MARLGFSWMGGGLLILALAPAAVATSFYVAPNGANTNRGTRPETPLATVQRAFQRAKAGDTILLRAGTYRQEVDLSGLPGGTPTAPIALRNYEGEQVILTGADPVTGWVQDHGFVWKKRPWRVNSQEVTVDGLPLQQIGRCCYFQTEKFGAAKPVLPTVGSGVDDIAPGSFYFERDSQTLWCELSDLTDPNGHRVEANVRRYVINGARAAYIHVSGLTLRNCNGTAYGDYGGVVQMAGPGWLIEDCTISGGDFSGVRLSGEDKIVRNCRIVDNGDVGIDMNGTDPTGKTDHRPNHARAPEHVLFDHLYVAGNNFRHFDFTWHAGGIKAIPYCRAVTVRNSEFIGNHGTGIWFDGDFGDIVVMNNLVVSNKTGIHYEISQPADGDAFGILVSNNCVAFNEAQGIYIADSSNARVENNTCYQNGWDIVVHGMPRSDANIQLHDNSVRNNIVHGRVSDIMIYRGALGFSNTVDGNLYVGGVRFGADTTPGYEITDRALDSVRRNYGWEENGLIANPHWKKPDALDFRLDATGVAQGKGWSPPASK